MSDAEPTPNGKSKRKPSATPRGWMQHARVRQAVIEVLAGGGTRQEAADWAGCSVRAIADECRRDEAFKKEVLNAEVNSSEFAIVGKIVAAAETDWRAAAWIAERVYWKKYAKRSPDQISPEQLVAVISRLVTAILADVPEDHRAKVRSNIDVVLGSLTSGAFIETKFTASGNSDGKPQS